MRMCQVAGLFSFSKGGINGHGTLVDNISHLRPKYHEFEPPTPEDPPCIESCIVTSSSPVPPKTHRVRQQCTLNLSRAETSSRWCGVGVRRGGVPSQVSSTSLDHGSKLRGPSPKVLV
ncbi:uncharacterized protein TNCV_1977561 [Trichonephila clavipes]|nr:uncharacterized protein TNCV_1977561 [Trichonephila clavipes]